jgi:mRNA interferase YafQ
MRTIEWTSQFKRDYKRESKGQLRAIHDVELFPIVDALANDQQLDPRYTDHALIGEWKDFRDCRIKPDRVLIYRKPDEEVL